MPAFYHFIHRLHGEKSFQNLTFRELAIFSTTLITQIIDKNALISYVNRIELTQSKSTRSQKCSLRRRDRLDLNVPRGMSITAVILIHHKYTCSLGPAIGVGIVKDDREGKDHHRG